MTRTPARNVLRRALLSFVGLALLSSAAPATATADDPAGSALAEARVDAARLIARADAIRADLDSGSFESIVARLASMAGLGSVRTPPPFGGPVLASLPPGVGAPVADLLAAASFAADSMRQAVQADGGRHLTLTRRSVRMANEIVAGLARGDRPPAKRALTLKTQVLESPILRAAARGGLAIGEALDRSLPRLRSAAASLPRTGRSAHGCDLVDQAPLLCVGGPDANSIHDEAVLVVDLGGDDTYTSSAGGANSARCEGDPDDTSCNASVLVDVDGDDTYLPGGTVTENHLVAGGSGMTGVGVLVDASGNDSYVAEVAGPPYDLSYVFGAANYGLGLLADLAGDDRYEVTGEPVLFNPYTHGASLDGMGALIDLGGSNVYRFAEIGEQRPDPVLFDRANRSASSFGTGIFGGAVLFDRTGYATIESVIDATAGAQDATNRVNPIGHGNGLVGQGAIFAGHGPTRYRSIARRVATASLPGQRAELPFDEVEGTEIPSARLSGGATATGMGVAVLGVGILQDLGGDDEYTATARSEHRLTVTADENCGCDRAIAVLDGAGWDTLAEAWFGTSNANVSAQGIASSLFVPNAGALMHDAGGDDTYTARAELVMSTRAIDRLGNATGARAGAEWRRSPSVTVFGQGIGSDFSPTVLQDDGGNDRYEMVADARTTAVAEGVGETRATALGAPVAVHGQGTSYFDPAQGALLDLGGRDEYEVHAISRATSSPGIASQDRSRTIGSQGAVGGVLADLDDGLTDSFAATPEAGPGVGFRGEGPGWIDTVNTFPGFGIAPLQPSKRDVAITVDAGNATNSTGGWVPFRARLTEAGAPIAGAELVFTFDRSLPALGGGLFWTPREERTHAITDAEGWATGHLWFDPVDEPSDEEYRVAVRYGGDTSRRAALTSQPFFLR